MTDVLERIEAIRERHDELQSKGAIYTEVETQTLANHDVPWLLSLVEDIGEALAEMPPKEVDALLDLTEMRCSEEHAETLAQVRDAALKREYEVEVAT